MISGTVLRKDTSFFFCPNSKNCKKNGHVEVCAFCAHCIDVIPLHRVRELEERMTRGEKIDVRPASYQNTVLRAWFGRDAYLPADRDIQE